MAAEGTSGLSLMNMAGLGVIFVGSYLAVTSVMGSMKQDSTA